MSDYQTSIAVLVLAAGASRRMGQTKQLMPWNETTLLGSVIQNAKASKADKVVVVVGANSEPVSAEAQKQGVPSVLNDRWEQGMGSSIVCGIKHLLEDDVSYAGVVIVLADQPLVDNGYLNSLIFHFREGEKQMVATNYKNKAGVPALFGRSYFEDLLVLNQEYGAKAFLKEHTQDTLLVEAGHRVSDIDTPEDYQDLRKRKQ